AAGRGTAPAETPPEGPVSATVESTTQDTSAPGWKRPGFPGRPPRRGRPPAEAPAARSAGAAAAPGTAAARARAGRRPPRARRSRRRAPWPRPSGSGRCAPASAPGREACSPRRSAVRSGAAEEALVHRFPCLAPISTAPLAPKRIRPLRRLFPPPLTWSGVAPLALAAPAAAGSPGQRRGLLFLHLAVPLGLGGLPGVLVAAQPPVTGDGEPLLGDPVLDPEQPPQLLDEAGLAVHERLHLPLGEVEAADGGRQRLADAPLPAVHPVHPHAAVRGELLLLLGPGHLDEDVRLPAGGQPLDRGGDGRQRALVPGQQVPVGL